MFQVLLFQKPHARSKSKDHVHCSECHPELWYCGDINSLVKEGKCIQNHLQSTIHSGPKSTNVVRKFDQLVILGKVAAAFNFFQQMPRVFCHSIQKYPVERMVMVILLGNQ